MSGENVLYFLPFCRISIKPKGDVLKIRMMRDLALSCAVLAKWATTSIGLLISVSEGSAQGGERHRSPGLIIKLANRLGRV